LPFLTEFGLPGVALGVLAWVIVRVTPNIKDGIVQDRKNRRTHELALKRLGDQIQRRGPPQPELPYENQIRRRVPRQPELPFEEKYPMLWLTAALIVVACLVEIVGAIAKIRVRQLRAQEACRDAFYRYADHLISDPETPEEVLKLINTMLSQVMSRAFLWMFLRDLATRKIHRRSSTVEIFKKVPPHLRADFVGVIISFIFSLTYNNILLGELVRRFILYSIPNTNDGDIGSVRPLGPMIDGFSRHGPSVAHSG
jgi:hypothetical protein